jgi:hypothetical protein
LYRPARLYIQPGEIDSLESILGLLKSLKIRAVLNILLCRDGGFHIKGVVGVITPALMHSFLLSKRYLKTT